MRKFALVSGAAVLVAASAAYLACLGQNREVVVDGRAGSQTSEQRSHVPLDQVDHSAWDRLLKTYVDRDGMVNYAGWKASEPDRAALKQYLAALSQADPEVQTAQKGQLAFWINAYNALTVYGILDVYPTSSIRNHTAKVFGYNIWKDLILPVGDKKYSLDAIEHQVLRKLGEPRIHFAIVCASVGCPRLRSEAYTPQRLDAQLAENARDFFSRSEHFRVDVEKRMVYISPILEWFGEDFGPNPRARLKKLENYLPEDSGIQELIEQGDFSVTPLEYNWSLNDQGRKAAK